MANYTVLGYDGSGGNLTLEALLSALAPLTVSATSPTAIQTGYEGPYSVIDEGIFANTYTGPAEANSSDIVEIWQGTATRIEGSFGTTLGAQITGISLFMYYQIAVTDGTPLFRGVSTGPGTTGPLDASVIFGGDDVLLGGARNDSLNGYDGADFIAAGDGADVIVAGAGDDRVWGDAGNDTIHGDEGADQLRGGDGNDALFGGDGNDLMSGDLGDDRLSGEDGDDVLYGQGGNDLMSGGDGNDRLLGDTGDDLVWGDEGDDAISGGDGNDTLVGHAGNDRIYGDAGRDLINGGDGDDELVGGAGDDVIYGDDDPGPTPATDSVGTPSRLTTSVTPPPGGNDLLSGGDGADMLFGFNGNDILYGGDGGDLLSGGEGADTLRGDAGDDWLYGGNGNDAFRFDEAGFGTDHIFDFARGDQLRISTTVFADFAAASAAISIVGADTLITAGNGDFIVLKGFTGLVEADFFFF